MVRHIYRNFYCAHRVASFRGGGELWGVGGLTVGGGGSFYV